MCCPCDKLLNIIGAVVLTPPSERPQSIPLKIVKLPPIDGVDHDWLILQEYC